MLNAITANIRQPFRHRIINKFWIFFYKVILAAVKTMPKNIQAGLL